MQVKKLAYGCGAEVTGVDLRKELPQAMINAIRAAWLEHLVLVFPGQDISIEQHIAFSRHFGELELHPVKDFQNDRYPEIIEITNRVIDGKPSETGEVGRNWHSDGAYTTRPPTGSLLHCRALPEYGGNTWFTSMVMAYDTLSPKMKLIVEDLEVVNDLNYYYQQKGIGPRQAQKVEDDARRIPPVIQPMVRVHPETGKKALYLNEAVTRQIAGLSIDEGAGLLQYLFKHSVRAEFTYRHYWRLHDIVFWDNRSVMHLAPKDYDSDQIRHMCRTTLVGASSGRLWQQEP